MQIVQPKLIEFPWPFILCADALVFTKMNGAGNDFIVLDKRTETISLTREQVVRLCDRHRGIGADGVLILIPCRSGKADWAWHFYNSDGSTGEMCGNGARCFARFVQKTIGLRGDFTFETEAGVITASFQGERVTVNLTKPKDLRLNEQIKLSTGTETIHSLNTGVPHAVVFVEGLEKIDVVELGRAVRTHKAFSPKGTNADFVEVLHPQSISVRTYERGVEDETLACGTGVEVPPHRQRRRHCPPLGCGLSHDHGIPSASACCAISLTTSERSMGLQIMNPRAHPNLKLK